MGVVKSLLTTIYCLPCIWSVIAFLGIYGGVMYLLNSWTPYKGPIPSEGKVEGFASAEERKKFFDTSSMRAQAATKFGLIAGATWFFVMAVLFFVLNTPSKADQISLAVTQTLAALIVTPTP
jgi:hypothetical protein